MLKALEIQKALDEKRQALEAINKRDFATRKAEIEKRLAELTTETPEEDKAAIEADADALAAEEAASKAEAETVRAEIEKLEKELDEEINNAPANKPEEGDQSRDHDGEKAMEVRDTKEYIEAFAAYIRSEGKEKRAILTEQATNGVIPVPSFVYDVVKTAWDREGIVRRVRKSYLKGNIKVAFEISGTDAVVHTEGGAGVAEEELVMGVVTLQAEDIKKWVSVSDKVLDLTANDGAESFLRYIYDELTYRIAKKAADQLIAEIVAAATVSTATAVGVPVVTVTAIGVGTVASAMALLSDEAAAPIVAMNKQSWGAFKTAQYAAQYPVDPFEGLEVEFNNSIKAFSVATTGDTVAIVGDFEQGALANFPDGEQIVFKFDDKTLMTQDLVRILGRRLSAIKPVAPNAFVKIVKG